MLSRPPRLDSPRIGVAAAALVAASVLACAPAMRSTIAGAPSRDVMAQFWNPPQDLDRRDLVYGAGGRREAPDQKAVYTLAKRKTGGFSPKVEVRDPSGMKWDVKMGSEAEPEVVASRIVWAMGYHQPPDYYVPVWTLDDNGKQRAAPPARFRPKPKWITKEGEWSWHANPFLETQAFRGLVVLMMILNSTDLKDDNNAVYDLKEPIEQAGRWYVVKDLGATLGETGISDPKRGDPDAFAKTGFITGTNGDRVSFDFHGRHRELLTVVHVADVHWMCGLLNRLTDRQWHDAFRAGGYNPDQTERFLRKIREKIAQGLALGDGA